MNLKEMGINKSNWVVSAQVIVIIIIIIGSFDVDAVREALRTGIDQLATRLS